LPDRRIAEEKIGPYELGEDLKDEDVAIWVSGGLTFTCGTACL